MRLIEGLNREPSLVTLLARLSTDEPDRPLLRHRDATGHVVDVSAEEVMQRSITIANGLRATGAQAGDRVAVLLPNSVDAIAIWFAIGMAGLVEVPINTELRGPVLRYVLMDSDPAVIVTDQAFLTILRECEYHGTAETIVWDAAAYDRCGSTPSVDRVNPKAQDLSTIMYTSGTTGPSKGVMLSHGYFANIGHLIRIPEPQTSSSDVFYVCTPMFHVDARLMMSVAMNEHAILAFAPRFSGTGFWRDVIDMDVSFFVFVGAMVSILAKTSDVDVIPRTRLRAAIGGPTPDEAYDFFEERHGVRLMEGYGMTECNGVTWSTPERRRRGAVGWESGPYEVRVVTPEGLPSEPGSVGEIIVRPGAPNLITSGYWNHQLATAEAFRDLWFHTGDLGRVDADGFLWFVGRAKDALRRRGENVSAFEVESIMSQAPDVLECAAVGVTDDLGGEDEILLYVVPRRSGTTDPEPLWVYAMDNLATFAVPRFIRFVRAMPHTPTGKVEKHRLEAALGADVFDRLQSEPRTPAAGANR